MDRRILVVVHSLSGVVAHSNGCKGSIDKDDKPIASHSAAGRGLAPCEGYGCGRGGNEK